MSKREKIIVLLMIGAILYGGYEFFWASSAGNKVENPAEKEKVLNKFVTDVADKLRKKDISVTDKYVIARAKDEWTQDPFLPTLMKLKPAESKEVEEEAAPKPSFKYSGYMEMGKRRLAIINGMEYATGDKLEPGGYRVKSISPAMVELIVTGTDNIVVIPVEEVN